ncbi:MAG: aliphatic sulfonate ABC transporter substrate-binding protein, partial [Clostridium sp.]
MVLKKLVIGVLTLTIGLTLASCTTKKEEAKEVRIGFFPNITHSQALYSKATGEFEKSFGNRVKVDYKTFNSGPSEVEAMIANELDIGYIGPGPAINAFEKTKGGIRILSGAADGGAIVVALSKSNIKTVKDLAGKKVSVPGPGNTQDLCLRALLKENGLSSTNNGGNVEVIKANNQDVKALLDKGSIDAAIVPEPWGSLLEIESDARVIVESNKVYNDGDYPVALVMVREKFVKSNPELVEKFLKAHILSTEKIKSNQGEAIKIINDELKKLTKKPLDEKILEKSFGRIKFVNDINLDVVKGFAKTSYDLGYLKK